MRTTQTMTTLMRFFLLLMILVLVPASSSAATSGYLYKTKLVQAAPGRLLDLIELHKSSLTEYRRTGDEQPLMMRHSQGDRWDLLLLIPMKSYADYYSPERVSKRSQLSISELDFRMVLATANPLERYKEMSFGSSRWNTATARVGIRNDRATLERLAHAT